MNFTKFDSRSDTASITASGNSVSVGRYSLRVREIILAVIAIVALILVVVLGVVLAVKSNDSDGGSDASGQTAASKQNPASATCETLECLKIAASQKSSLKEDVDPCDDFYTFACGNYAKAHPLTPQIFDMTPRETIYHFNRDRIEALLSPELIADNSIPAGQKPDYEKKLKIFMESCNNHFDKTDLRGQPLIDNVIKPMGGWWVFGDNVLDSFDLQKSFRMTQVDFLAPAFFSTSLTPNNNDLFQNVVELNSGQSLLYYIYTETQYEPQVVHSVYISYIKHLAYMLCRDNNIVADSARVDQFAEDVFLVEGELINHMVFSDINFDSHNTDQLWTIKELHAHVNETLDFLDYFKAMFNEYPSHFNENSKVAIPMPGYFSSLGNTLKTHMENGTDGKRKIHNYLTWVLINYFAEDLSWDYVHAVVKLHHILTDSPSDTSFSDYCFYLGSRSFFRDGLSAFYLKNLVDKRGRDEANNMVNSIKTVLMQSIKDLTWMSESNRNYAVKKIESSLYKIGYPDKLMDDNYLNNEYSFVNMNVTDFFGNIMELLKGRKHAFNQALLLKHFRGDWVYSYYDPIIIYDNPWQDFVITSAILQNPLFHPDGSHFYNYGGVGSSIAANLIHAVDEIGAYYSIGGSHFGSWWNLTTQNGYESVRQCAVTAWENSKPGPFSLTDEDGNTQQVPEQPVSRTTDGWTSSLLASASGIQMAYKVYKNMEAKNGPEKIPPGFSQYTPDQMFFISYAQSMCQNAHDLWLYYRLVVLGRAPNREMVSLSLQQVPEFKAAFNCPAKPNEPKPCVLFH